jgi:hypothetical protein
LRPPPPPVAEPATDPRQVLHPRAQQRVILPDRRTAQVVRQQPINRHARRSLILREATRCATAGRFPAGVKALQPLRLADIHIAILGIAFRNGRIADAILAAQIGNGPRLVPLGNADDPVTFEPAALLLWCFRLGHCLPQTG